MFILQKPLERSYFSGFSLIELMIVLIIIGFLSSFIVISLGDNFVRELRNEAEKLQKIIIAGSEEAIFSGSELAIDLDNNRYSLVKLDPLSGSWSPFNFQSFDYYKLPKSMEIVWNIEGFYDQNTNKSVSYDDEFFGINTVQNREIESSISNSNQTIITPDILLMSSGEVSVFEIFFIASDIEDTETIIRLKSDGFSIPLVEYTNEFNRNE